MTEPADSRSNSILIRLLYGVAGGALGGLIGLAVWFAASSDVSFRRYVLIAIAISFAIGFALGMRTIILLNILLYPFRIIVKGLEIIIDLVK